MMKANAAYLRLVILLVLFSPNVYSIEAETKQTLRGVVRDKESMATLIGANVVVVNSNPFIGASTDINGQFTLSNVPVGRVDLRVTYMGYEDRLIVNLLVTAGKQVVLDIEMVESFTKLNEFVIEGKKEKREVINEMAILSAHSVSVEETKRFAGSINDPARMVSSFAGVSGDAGGRNDIVVRGNSPKGILWRLEGVEIPNPNHFSSEGATGGPINALNSNMLANSDFFTGAFAPEYGNASSGVFDMKLRKGNNEKREYSLGVSVIGLDATMEGPFTKNSNASYLANYRYSSLAILDDLRLVDFSGVPKYQDGSFKIHIPSKKLGAISMFGLGGLSSISQADKDADAPEKVHAKGVFSANLGVVGINQVLETGKNSYIRNTFSISTNGSGEEYLVNKDDEFESRFKENQQKTAYRIGTSYNSKINNRHSVKVGGFFSLNQFSFLTIAYNNPEQKMVTALDEEGTAGLLQSYGTWKYRITENLTLVSGLHYMHFLLNNAVSVEPRLALRYQLNEEQAINIGYGKHSKLEPLTLYFSNTQNFDGSISHPNRNLNFGKANHYVLGYQNMLMPNLLFKAEAYYQFLYGVPVVNSASSTFSMINSTGWFTTNELVNKGFGRNYGLELTLDKHFSKGYYFLLTTSLYQAEYKTLENKWRSTQFNGNYVANALFGKEFRVGPAKKNRTMGISGKVMLASPQRYTPIDLEESKRKGYAVRDESKIFGAKGDRLFMANMVVYYRKDFKRTSHEIRFDIQNITYNKAKLSDHYNSRTESIMHAQQLPLIPVIFYKIDF